MTDYDRLRRDFRWAVPARFNIAVSCCDRHADGTGRPAILTVEPSGALRPTSFDQLRALSARLANLLEADGLGRGDRVGVLLPQSVETAAAHLAAFRAGLVSVPLFLLFGPEALGFRLRHSGARALVTDADGLAKVLALRPSLPDLARVYVVGDGPVPAGCTALGPALARAADAHRAADTRADDPALIIYTSGTTGPPKGALHAHRVLLGHLPGVELPHARLPRPGDRLWTPADWAWIGGLLDVLLPGLHHGVPVVAHRARRFEPDAAYALMARHAVRNVFLPPTALRMLRAGPPPPPDLALRSVASGGETLGAGLLDWGRSALGVPLHEFYGQTECNLVAGNCTDLFPIRPGSLGRALPGHAVGVVDADGRPVPDGEVGAIAVRRPDPVLFLGYWDDPAATAAKFAGDWLVTGDLGRRDADGHFWFVGRADDVISSGGYRIGPGEVEDCLARHPAVALAAVAGVPDPVRGEAVKAWVVPRPGFPPSEDLARAIQDFVRARLAAHEYPRHVAFVDALPLTATGKVMRRELRRLG